MSDLLSDLTNTNEQLIGLVLTIIAIVFIVSILRSVFRLFMPVLVVGLVMVVFLEFTPAEVIHKGKQIVMNGSQLILDEIAPFLQPEAGGADKNGKKGMPPEHDPFKDEEGPNRDDQEIDMFRGQEDEDIVNKL
jgi:hypothetical protein